ncbi:MAG: ABC transporter substrate-binding protein [Puniceicoccales bacterium]|jgi:ABC-type Fe3+ transport system substrate-binding protein|nr:ABC transporter substrate-binding protein [Puniceicoccales bacterium]
MASLAATKKFFLAGTLAAIVALPFLVRERGRAINAATDDTVVILTGHNENLRFELGQGFQKWYKEQTGRTVFVDWRYLGGVSEIVRYLDSVYGNAFRLYWEKELGQPWNGAVQGAFVRRTADSSRWTDPVQREVCKAFYGSDIGSGIDIFFGGGVSEFVIQADRGTIVDCGFLREHPELFCESCIPPRVGDEPLWDGEGRWFGQCLSTLGILCNRAVLAARGLEDKDVGQWAQLTDPRLFGSVALADPTKSSALLKAYETIIQQQMLFRERELAGSGQRFSSEKERKMQIVGEGWLRGLRTLQLIAANTRYFADAPTKMILDVASGNSAVGIIVDFLGEAQAAFDRSRCGWDRLHFFSPPNGTVVSPDPIAVLRGAPNREVAKLFLEYILGEEGQKIIVFRVGTPGGPIRNELFRPAVNRKVYDKAYAPYRTTGTDDQIQVLERSALTYRPEYTASVYSTLKWMIKFAFMVPHRELVEAWAAILSARTEGRSDDAERALRILEDFSGFAYDEINDVFAAVLQPTRPAAALEVQRRIAGHFRDQYLLAKRTAEGI